MSEVPLCEHKQSPRSASRGTALPPDVCLLASGCLAILIQFKMRVCRLQRDMCVESSVCRVSDSGFRVSGVGFGGLG